MISAPAGAVFASSLILSPAITITTFLRRESPRPSKTEPHRSATIFPSLAVCPTTESHENKETKTAEATFPLIIPPNDERRTTNDEPLITDDCFLHFLCKPCGQPG